VRFERLVIAAGSNTFTLNLHPRLTVIAGVGRVERDSLIGELVGALGSGRTGVHLEMVEDNGRRLAVFRPAGARHRVVDIDAAADVSREYALADGRLDLLGREGLDLRTARRRMRLGADDLTASTQGGQFIRQLAAADQTALWGAADRVRTSDDKLQTEAEAVGSAPEDAEIVERIERRHAEFEAAQSRHEKSRQRSILISTICAAAAAPAVIFKPPIALGLVGICCLTILLSLRSRRRMVKAQGQEQDALAEAGAQSYLGFHLQRVNGLLSSGQSRKRLMAAADEHRQAIGEWHAIAGDIQVEWASDHKEEILAAARLRKDVSTLGSLSTTAPTVDTDRTTDLARALVGRLTDLRRAGSSGESFPLILDDPFIGLEPSVKPALLELLGRSSGNPQIIFLTEDEDVASWARLEALTGEIVILEPTPDAQAPAADRPVPAEVIRL
jgi:hypothetical protein